MFIFITAMHVNTGDRDVVIQDDDYRNVTAAQKGDMDAFEALIKKYEAKVFNVASHMLTNQEDARDAAQEVFIRVYKAIPGFRGDSKFSTWLYRVINNVCLDYLRKRNNRVISLDDEFNDGEGEKTAREVPDAFDLEAAAENAEFRKLVQIAVKKLPEQQRVMILMRDMQDLSYTEISWALNLPEGTVKSRINRARKRLRDIVLESKELYDYIRVK